jgi:hypothetical protein
MIIDYQSYYDPTVQFEDDDCKGESNQVSYERFCGVGFSDDESARLVTSGYTVLHDQIVIDRFHGGHLLSIDLKTRFRLDNFRQQFGAFPNQLPVYRAESLNDVYKLVETMQTRERRPLAFRGQTGHYSLQRPVPNPTFNHVELGEISLLPSVWRRVLKERMSVLHQFRDLSMLEWSVVMYDMFDIPAIHEMEQKAGFWPGNVDLDDLPDEPEFLKLREFHAFRNAFLNEYGFGSGAPFLTLLQHYGLNLPVLDLTSSLEVALFFATQKFARTDGLCSYNFVGTNQRKAIIYVLRQDQNETLEYHRGELLKTLDPQRPKRQACIVMPTNTYAMNLAADFLVAAIRLDFDMANPGALSATDLFPDEKDDQMLSAFRRKLAPELRSEVTVFS